MSRKKNTWFGFNLTQKQSVHIFILSIIGLFISVFLLMMMVCPLIVSFIYYDHPDNSYMMMVIFSMLPIMFVLCGIFLLSLYSLIQCRKIAKYYSPLVDPVLEPKTKSRYNEVTPDPIAQFCPNCGKLKKGHEKFCTNCGQ
jgi:vacuolar-type H+-ATPase subunit I/STV1